jgi:hypothetical protein
MPTAYIATAKIIQLSPELHQYKFKIYYQVSTNTNTKYTTKWAPIQIQNILPSEHRYKYKIYYQVCTNTNTIQIQNILPSKHYFDYIYGMITNNKSRKMMALWCFDCERKYNKWDQAFCFATDHQQSLSTNNLLWIIMSNCRLS